MSKLAFIFPGQGSQSIGMGAGLSERFPESRSLYKEASAILGWDLLHICREGPEEKLRETDITQPALYVTGIAAATVLMNRGINPEAAAGHSIGEYAALAAAGVFSFAEGLKLVEQRSRLMKDAARRHPGGMAAILGLNSEQTVAVCSQASSRGVCVAVNFNSPEQVVIAGETAALAEASKLALANGAKRVIPLNVSGAFHSPLMKEAALAMKALLEKAPFREPRFPVAMNADGRLHSTAAEIRAQLALQLDHPVRWVDSIRSLSGGGFSSFIECGSGRVLAGLLKRIEKSLEVRTTESAEALEQITAKQSTAGKE
jgi:[acyl-carrier-protein] S-malonyltransferase